MDYKKYLRESRSHGPEKIGNFVSFHNDNGMMTLGRITNMKKKGKKIIYTIEADGIKFTRDTVY